MVIGSPSWLGRAARPMARHLTRKNLPPPSVTASMNIMPTASGLHNERRGSNARLGNVGAEWASTAARWRISAGRAPRRKPRRATDAQVLEDADRLIGAWNERQANRMPMLFSPPSAPPSPPAIGFCGCAVRLPDHQCDRLAHT